jgi:predicted RNA polymerase sigma factor
VTDAAAVEAAVAETHRRDWARVLAATVRVARDLDLAEECVQEAYASALGSWVEAGIPADPAAWLTTTAKRRAVDAIRREARARSRLPLLVVTAGAAGDEPPEADDPGTAIPDERLRLIFTCCHPALAQEARIALTLRLVRAELVDRAMRLARMLRELMPHDTEVAGLFALLLVTDARRAARIDSGGRLVRLADQDRSRWDRAALAEAHDLIVGSLRAGAPGRYALQAAIASLYAQAPSYEQTDWRQIVALYDRLLEVWPSPVVALNRAVPLAMVRGPAAALAEVEMLQRDGRLSGYHYLPAIKADLLSRLGRGGDAAEAYRRAFDLAANEAERAFLAEQIHELR